MFTPNSVTIHHTVPNWKQETHTHKKHMSSSSIVKSQASVHDSRMNKYHISLLKCQLRKLEDSLNCTLVKCEKTKVLDQNNFQINLESVHHLLFQSAMTHFSPLPILPYNKTSSQVDSLLPYRYSILLHITSAHLLDMSQPRISQYQSSPL
jgi:hypothetical protein